MPKDSNILFWTRDELRQEVASLQALTAEMDKTINASQAECRRLKAEDERLTAFSTCTIIPNEILQAQVERLTKAGDEMALNLTHIGWNICVEAWNAAKESKQS